MQTTHQQLESFHQFALQKLQSENGGGRLSFMELVQLWHLENPSAAERANVVSAIEIGKQDIEAGNYRPVESFMDEMRSKHGIPTDDEV